MQGITYRVDQFEGPLDLLLSLIAKNKISIDDIPISVLCSQYMEYMEQARQMDMELSSEFIVMASELMLLKSRMLLPRHVEEEDPRAALAAALTEYQRAKEASRLFAELYAEFGGRFEKDTDEIVPDPTYVAEHDVSLLVSALMRAYAEKTAAAAPAAASAEAFTGMLKRRTVSVTGKIFSLLRLLRRQGTISACQYFDSAADRPELLSMFMAVLELLRAQRLRMDCPTEDAGHIVVLNAHKSITFTLDRTPRPRK